MTGVGDLVVFRLAGPLKMAIPMLSGRSPLDIRYHVDIQDSLVKVAGQYPQGTKSHLVFEKFLEAHHLSYEITVNTVDVILVSSKGPLRKVVEPAPMQSHNLHFSSPEVNEAGQEVYTFEAENRALKDIYRNVGEALGRRILCEDSIADKLVTVEPITLRKEWMLAQLADLFNVSYVEERQPVEILHISRAGTYRGESSITY